MYVIVRGNLTQDPVLEKNKDGRMFYRFRIAENMPEYDQRGKVKKDSNGHTVNKATHYHTVFVNDKGLFWEMEHAPKPVKSGSPVKVGGYASLGTAKDSNDYDLNVIKFIRATSLDFDPYNNLGQQGDIGDDDSQTATEQDLEDIPFET